MVSLFFYYIKLYTAGIHRINKKGARLLKLKAKILSLSIVPLIILGIFMLLISKHRMEDAVYKETYAGLNATTLAVRDIFETGNDGKYHLDENGEHVINTKAPQEVTEQVLEKGKPFHGRDIKILDSTYIVYYTPIFQNDSDEVVGMVFLGQPQKVVTNLVDECSRKLVMAILIILVLAGIVVLFIGNGIVQALQKSMGLLHRLANGDLNIQADSKILKRKDEVSSVTKSILNLQDRLRQMIMLIHDKGENVSQESEKLESISDKVYHVMENVNQAAQEIATSSSSQSEDGNQASRNVVAMGEMIGENGAEVMRLNGISDKMKAASKLALEQLGELNKVMNNVKEAIQFLAKQTGLTNDSVTKISDATELITAIASQTNLLSLNASIEAARAGEHGLGFSVVAQEIQQLSEQSNAATYEIKNIVNSLNDNSNQTMEYMKNVQTVIDEEEDIQKASEMFQSVSDGIDETVAGMEQIMVKMRKLEDVRTDTVAIVQSAASIAEENSASIEELMSSVETIYQNLGNITENTKYMSKLSEEMKESILAFSM